MGGSGRIDASSSASGGLDCDHIESGASENDSDPERGDGGGESEL